MASVGSMKIGVIAEGTIDHVLLNALLQRIADERAHLAWAFSPEDVAEVFRIRKRGHGGVLKSIQKLVAVMENGAFQLDYDLFVVLLDGRAKQAQRRVRQLISGRRGFVFGIAIQEIEAWWLGDRQSTLAWLRLTDSLPKSVRYAAKGYKAEQDRAPKRTLDELTMQSSAVNRRYGHGNRALAEDFAESWRSTADIAGIEGQCPRGFAPFCKDTARALQSASKRPGRLF